MPSDEIGEAARKGRHAWLDNARGIGIVLVVYGHQMRAQATMGNVPAAWSGPFQDALIYSFHMPLFFFLSGVVSLKSIQNKPFGVSLSDKLQSIAYPYFLWSIISWCLSALATTYVNTPMDVWSLASIFYQPILQYWFLYVLFFCQLLALLLRRVFVANFVVVAILLVIPFPFISPTINEFVASFPFFVVGMMVSGFFMAQADDRSGRLTWAALFGALAIFIALMCWRPVAGSFASACAMVQAWAGIAVVVLVSRIIAARWSWLSALGQASMAIFVMHTIVAAAIRVLLGKVGIDDPLVMLVACVGGGVLVPLAIERVAARYGLEAWLGLGKPNRPGADSGRVTASVVP